MNHPSTLNSNTIYWKGLLTLAGIKMLVHFFANTVTKYGFHRDEYLYISEGDHLAWGYMEVPPVIAVIGKTARFIFGDTLFAIRFFPALIGAITIILIGIMVKDLGGKKHAQLIGSFGFLISPAFLGSNNLFQPVSFNQFMWFLSAFLLVKIVRYQEKKYWYYLGIAAGLGFLTKYSIVFLFIAMAGGLLLTPHRKLFLTKYPYISLGIAFLIALPNLWWQASHDFPVVRHMNDLAHTQLVNVRTTDFLIPQFLDHFAATLIWLPGLVYIFYAEKLKPYRFLGWAYLLVVLFLLLMNGKDYYTFGAYAMLFATGGLAWAHWLGKKSLWLIPIVAILNVFVIPLALPILPIEKMEAYGLYLKDHFGLEAPLRWEDGSIRTLRQDYADMHGWEEIPQKVAKLYHSLSPEEQKTCLLYAGHYGQAGVLNFYRKKYSLPETYSFNASFVAWVPEEMDIKLQIQVDDNPQDSSAYFHSVELIDSIENPYARDPGFIYLKSQPKMDLRPIWRELVRTQRQAAGYD